MALLPAHDPDVGIAGDGIHSGRHYIARRKADKQRLEPVMRPGFDRTLFKCACGTGARRMLRLIVSLTAVGTAVQRNWQTAFQIDCCTGTALVPASCAVTASYRQNQAAIA